MGRCDPQRSGGAEVQGRNGDKGKGSTGARAAGETESRGNGNGLNADRGMVVRPRLSLAWKETVGYTPDAVSTAAQGG